MYNPLPAGKSAKLAVPRGAPVWQPLKPLKPVELQNAGFVQENYMRPKSSHFALWTVEEQVAAGKMAEDSDELANPDRDVDASGLTSDAGHVNSEDGSSTSLSGLDAEALEKIKKEAYDRGVADGKKLQQEALIEETQQTEAESLTALADKANQLLVSIEQGVVALQENPASWNEPLKRLALHLAEQLTLTELSLSSNSIEALVLRCIETLDIPKSSPIAVELNPSDMAILQARTTPPGEEANTWRLQADPTLLPGSVRVRADDAVVSDLIEHRLETLAQALLQDTTPWQAQTAFQPERLAARRGKAETVEDALPRNTSSRFTQAKEKADLVDTEFDDVLDVTATPQTATPEPLNLSALDLPDLNLSDAKPLSEDDESGASNV